MEREGSLGKEQGRPSGWRSGCLRGLGPTLQRPKPGEL